MWAIGGVNLVAEGELGGLSEWAEPWQKAVAACQRRRGLVVEVARMGAVPGITPVFETDGSWSFGRAEGRTCFYYRPDGAAWPHWYASLDREGRSARLCISPRVRGSRPGMKKQEHPFRYPLSYLLVMQDVVRVGGVTLHASAVRFQGKAWVFAGPTGSGKSTLARLASRMNGIEVLSDDRVILRKCAEGWTAYGTPWAGASGLGSDGSAALAGLFFLAKSAVNKIRRLPAPEAMRRLMTAVAIPWYEPHLRDRALASCDSLLSAVNAMELGFVPDRTAAALFMKVAALSGTGRGCGPRTRSRGSMPMPARRRGRGENQDS